MANSSDKTLYLIDGHALIFKMYYALLKRPMVNSKGVDTSILYGFTKYILELISRQRPSHFAVAFDPPGGTFRNKLYPEYKANRSATPQLIIDALEPLTEICRCLGIPVLMEKGFEADDVIGSMAKRAEKEGFEVYMVTPDKDYGQLVSEHIHQYRPGKSGNEAEILDIQAICSKYGIERTEQVIDMLSICGDASDNVPGVKGVGEVGAGKLIARYGSLENIYQHLDELSPKQKQMFEDAKGHIGLSKELVTIKTDIVLECTSESMRLGGGSEKIHKIFDEYEFFSLKKMLNGLISLNAEDTTEDSTEQDISGTEENTVREINFTECDAEVVCKQIIEYGKCSICINSQGEAAVACKGENGLLVAKSSTDSFAAILEDSNIVKYCHDIKDNLKSVKIEGCLMDTTLMDYVINPEKSHKFDSLCKSILGISAEKADDSDSATELSLFENDSDDTDLSREAALTFELALELEKELDRQGLTQLYLEIEAPLIPVLADMEICGVRMDLDSLRDFAGKLRKEVNERQEHIREMCGKPGLNISSPKQIAELIYDDLKLLPRKKKGNSSTDEETLLSIIDKHPVVREILEFRAAKKLLSTYIEPFPDYISAKDGKIHTSFNQAMTATGRLSSSNPNLQNIPIRSERGKEIRKAFVSSHINGVIMSADYSQIELRIMAELSKDEHLKNAFISGIDVHKATAAKIFGTDSSQVDEAQRRIAKTANFGIMYGISAFGLSQRLGCSRYEAKQIIDDYFAGFPSIRNFIDKVLEQARDRSYVETIFGRRRYVPDVNSHNGTVRSLAERNAVNAPIQGSSADIIKLAMINLHRRIKEEGLRSRMVLQIHDELLFDVVEDEILTLKKIVKEEMENVVSLSIPLTVECDYGKNWLEAH